MQHGSVQRPAVCLVMLHVMSDPTRTCSEHHWSDCMVRPDAMHGVACLSQWALQAELSACKQSRSTATLLHSLHCCAGFFIWPISSPSSFVNVATIPNTTIPVSIMSVNVQTNKTYFVANNYVAPPGVSAKAAEMNGMTVEMSTRPYQVTAGTTYHLKLGIADGRCTGLPAS